MLMVLCLPQHRPSYSSHPSHHSHLQGILVAPSALPFQPSSLVAALSLPAAVYLFRTRGHAAGVVSPLLPPFLAPQELSLASLSRHASSPAPPLLQSRGRNRQGQVGGLIC